MWQSVLERSRARRQEDGAELLFLGRGADVVHRFVQRDGVVHEGEGAPLDYGAFQASDSEDADPLAPRIGVWTVAEERFADLIDKVIAPESVRRTTVAIAVDLSRPRDAIRSLEAWLSVVAPKIDAALERCGKGAREEHRAAGGRYHARASLAEDGKLPAFSDAQLAEAAGGEGLPAEALSCPLIIVACSAEAMPVESYEERQRFRFLQAKLRHFALRHAATLAYVSASEDPPLRLQQYLHHRLFPTLFTFEAGASDAEESLFLPQGYDSVTMVEALSGDDDIPADADIDKVFSEEEERSAEKENAVGAPELETIGTDEEWLVDLEGRQEDQIRAFEDTLKEATRGIGAGGAPASEAKPEARTTRRSSRRTAKVSAKEGSGGGENQDVKDFFSSLLN